MPQTRNALMAFVVIVTLATVACQPSDPIAEAEVQATHPVIVVPPGPTLLPNAAALAASSAAPR